MKKGTEGVQCPEVSRNYSVATEYLEEELSYLKNETLIKTLILKTITENQYHPSTSSGQRSSNTKELYCEKGPNIEFLLVRIFPRSD